MNLPAGWCRDALVGRLASAVEAMESIKINARTRRWPPSNFQNYFRMYSKLAGISGTAYTEANEFKEIYNLDTVVIPTNRGLIRETRLIYKTAPEKYNAVVDEITSCHQKGQPVLWARFPSKNRN